MPSIGENIIFSPRNRILRHILFWIVYLLVFSTMSYLDLDNFWEGVLTTTLNAPVNILYTYVISYWLVPRFLVKGKYLQFFTLYIIWGVSGLVINFLFRYYVLIPFRATRPGPAPDLHHVAFRQVFALFSFVVMNLIAMFAVFIQMFKYFFIEQRQKMQIEQEKTVAELELLKAQLHPHFLFNTLNNLYSLVLERSDKAPDMLMRLSALLTYVLYECKAPEVPLDKEIKVIRDYVALEQERYGDRLDVSMNFSGDTARQTIAPMLFQPFVENAFKHGTSEQIGRVWMSIELSVKDGQLFFRVINSVDKNYVSAGTGGIGIHNVRRRLELLYPGRSNLWLDTGEDVYIISFTIELEPGAKPVSSRKPILKAPNPA